MKSKPTMPSHLRSRSHTAKLLPASLDHLVQSSFKRYKRAHSSNFPSIQGEEEEMTFFAPHSHSNGNHFLSPPSLGLSRKRSQHFQAQSNRRNNDVDEYSDLEISFASNVSLNSPPRENISLADDSNAMDISPAPASKPTRIPPSVLMASGGQRPRSFTSGARLFGNDLSNSRNPSSSGLMPSAKVDAKTTNSGSKKTQRSALPFEWLQSTKESQAAHEPSSPMDDAMDVDTSFSAADHEDNEFDSEQEVDHDLQINHHNHIIDSDDIAFSPVASSREPHHRETPSPTITSGQGINQLFYDTVSPRRSFESPIGPHHKKRRSLSPDSAPRGLGQTHAKHMQYESSSPMLPSSPSDSKLERMAQGKHSKPGLQGLGAAPAPAPGFGGNSGLGNARRRRPVLSAMVQPYDRDIQSAYPILSPPSGEARQQADDSPRGAVPVRRAFSAFLPPSIYTEQDDDGDTSFEGQPDMSSPAQAYSKRQQVKTIRRCDGTEDFRPLTGVSALVQKEMNLSPASKFMAPGLPGFGDNEKNGKILPCHRVTEDGLMRINGKTLDDLLNGKYDEQITSFHVIDCRFDYEYNGGHVPGAVNINTTVDIEELLLGPSLTKPKPSVSGDSTRKTILIFHCEFSAKRAPTFAKHLRAKDRAMNNHVYPKIHYPEVYILEGGYCAYFKQSGHRCEPPGYVTMDDPNHATSRREDLDQFRKAKFGRHKSYAYGDGTSKSLMFGSSSMQAPAQVKRNTAPSAPPSLFAAATAARSRRTAGGGSGGHSNLMTLQEDGNATADDTDTDLGDSPCPPPNKASTFKMMGSKATLKGVRLSGIIRSESYGPTKMPF